MPLPPAVATLAADRLNAVEESLPGLVTALWITGSAAAGDYRPGRSDVDFVAATSRVPTPADVAGLTELHAAFEAGFPAQPHWDGLYVPAAALAGPPSAQEPVPHAVDGVFGTGACGQRTPVGWLGLRQDGVAVRGPAPVEVVAAPEPAALNRPAARQPARLLDRRGRRGRAGARGPARGQLRRASRAAGWCRRRPTAGRRTTAGWSSKAATGRYVAEHSRRTRSWPGGAWPGGPARRSGSAAPTAAPPPPWSAPSSAPRSRPRRPDFRIGPSARV